MPQDPNKENFFLDWLSPAERKSLGTQLTPKKQIPTEEEWPKVRDWLFSNSKKAQPYLTPESVAYTPGETLRLMEQPAYKSWHEYASNFKVPEGYKTVIFVPCAKTKPWGTATRGLYKDYNKIRAEMAKGNLPQAYFVTISEPLGIVPEQHWDDFIVKAPYDNPGLFKDPAMRSGGAHNEDWNAKFGKVMAPPFDEKSYKIAVDKLSNVISSFMKNNPNLEYLSFVDDPGGKKTSHGDMVREANKKTNGMIKEENFFIKKPLPEKGVSAYAMTPYPLLKEKILGLLGNPETTAYSSLLGITPETLKYWSDANTSISQKVRGALGQAPEVAKHEARRSSALPITLYTQNLGDQIRKKGLTDEAIMGALVETSRTLPRAWTIGKVPLAAPAEMGGDLAERYLPEAIPPEWRYAAGFFGGLGAEVLAAPQAGLAMTTKMVADMAEPWVQLLVDRDIANRQREDAGRSYAPIHYADRGQSPFVDYLPPTQISHPLMKAIDYKPPEPEDKGNLFTNYLYQKYEAPKYGGYI